MFKKMLLACTLLFLTIAMHAQNIQWEKGSSDFPSIGTLPYTDSYRADRWGADPRDVAVNAALVVGRDGTPADSCGCQPLTNQAEINDAVALLYRGGGCEFSVKAYNVQLAGAVACIIVNSDNYAINMLKGANAQLVQIPVLMVAMPEGTEPIEQQIAELSEGTLPELTSTYNSAMCLSFLNDKPQNGERKFYQALKWVTGKVFEIDTKDVKFQDIERFWNSYYPQIKCDGPQVVHRWQC